MAGRIPQSFIDELISRSDIVEIIGSRVPLKKAGREFKACCPFHDEKTPSFWVSPDKQFFHCFGCSAHGTALGFLMQYDQLPFPEAVEELAGRVGLEVPHEGGAAPASAATEGQSELLARVASFYQECLRNDERASAYVRKRGLDAAIIDRFMIGYAPESWNEVLRRFGATDDSRAMLLAGGLIIERDTPRAGSEPYYDRFRDRIMFPIRDPRGRVLGFGGRILDRGEPKYLNSPETELFHKGRELYGLHEIRLARQNLKRLIVVEGYMDVVRLHQAGLQYAVATLGTATTPEHLRRVFRLVSEVVFAFDGDRAGRAAAWRALQNVLPEVREGREIRFLFLPDGEDPDSLVGREGREAFEQRLATAVPLSEYLTGQLRGQVELTHADGRARYAALARPLLEKIPAGIYRELLIERIAQEIGLGADRLRDLLRLAEQAPPPPTEGQHRSAPVHIGRGALLTQAIQTLLHFPAAARELPGALWEPLEQLEQPGIAVLCEMLRDQSEAPGTTTGQILERWRDRPEFERLSELAAAPILATDTGAAAHELGDAISRLLDEQLRRRMDQLIEKAREGTVTAQERSELQVLSKSLSRQIQPGPLPR
jgi:DNA primase